MDPEKVCGRRSPNKEQIRTGGEVGTEMSWTVTCIIGEGTSVHRDACRKGEKLIPGSNIDCDARYDLGEAV